MNNHGLITAAPQPAMPAKPRQILAQARKFYSEARLVDPTKYDVVIRYTQKIIELEPENAAAYHLLAKAYHYKQFHVRTADERRKLNSAAAVNALLMYHHDSHYYFCYARLVQKILPTIIDEQALANTEALMRDYQSKKSKDAKTVAERVDREEVTFHLLRSSQHFYLGDYPRAYEDAVFAHNLFVTHSATPPSSEVESREQYIQALILASVSVSARGQNGDHELAVKWATQAHALDPNDSLTLFTLGYAHYFKDKQLEHTSVIVRGYLTKARPIMTESPYAAYCKRAVYRRGSVYQMAFNAEFYNSERYLSVSPDAKQDSATYVSHYASALYNDEKYDEAMNAARTAKTLHNNDISNAVLAGISFLRGDYSNALLSVKATVDCVPDFLPAQNQWAEMAKLVPHLQKMRAAKKPSPASAPLDPQAKVVMDTKSVFVAMTASVQSVTATNKLMQLRLLFQQGKTDKTKYTELVKLAHQFLNEEPIAAENPDIQHLLSKALLKLDDFEGAKKFACIAIEAHPRHQLCCGLQTIRVVGERQQDLVNLGLLNLGLAGPAALRTSLNYLRRGLIHYAEEHYDKAYTDAQTALQKKTDEENLVDIYILLATTATKLGKYDEALKHAIAANKLDPQDISTILVLCTVHLFKDNKAEHEDFSVHAQANAHKETKYKMSEYSVAMFAEDRQDKLSLATVAKMELCKVDELHHEQKEAYAEALMYQAETACHYEDLKGAEAKAERALVLTHHQNAPAYLLLSINLLLNNRENALRYALKAAEIDFLEHQKTCKYVVDCLKPYVCLTVLEHDQTSHAITSKLPQPAAPGSQTKLPHKDDKKGDDGWRSDAVKRVAEKKAKEKAKREAEEQKRLAAKKAKEDNEAAKATAAREEAVTHSVVPPKLEPLKVVLPTLVAANSVASLPPETVANVAKAVDAADNKDKKAIQSTVDGVADVTSKNTRFKIYTLGAGLLNPVSKDDKELVAKMKEDPTLILQLLTLIRNSENDTTYTRHLAAMRALVPSIKAQYYTEKARATKIIRTALLTGPFVYMYPRLFELGIINELFPHGNFQTVHEHPNYLRFLHLRLGHIANMAEAERTIYISALLLSFTCYTKKNVTPADLLNANGEILTNWGAEILELPKNRERVIAVIETELVALKHFMATGSLPVSNSPVTTSQVLADSQAAGGHHHFVGHPSYQYHGYPHFYRPPPVYRPAPQTAAAPTQTTNTGYTQLHQI